MIPYLRVDLHLPQLCDRGFPLSHSHGQLGGHGWILPLHPTTTAIVLTQPQPLSSLKHNHCPHSNTTIVLPQPQPLSSFKHNHCPHSNTIIVLPQSAHNRVSDTNRQIILPVARFQMFTFHVCRGRARAACHID